jgi:hypothetical protein
MNGIRPGEAFRLLVNRSVTWASWDEELLAVQLQELSEVDFTERFGSDRPRTPRTETI